MDQKQGEKNLAPGNEPEGLLRRSETPIFQVEEEAVKETAEVSQPVEGVKPAEVKSGLLPRPKKIKKTAVIPPPARDELTLQVEKLLADGLKDTYEKLSPIAQQEFKLKGEQTAAKIREMMRSAKVKVKKIFRLIIEWLMLLPSVNHFFLEQEAKIKTDKIIALKKQDDERIRI